MKGIREVLIGGLWAASAVQMAVYLWEAFSKTGGWGSFPGLPNTSTSETVPAKRATQKFSGFTLGIVSPTPADLTRAQNLAVPTTIRRQFTTTGNVSNATANLATYVLQQNKGMSRQDALMVALSWVQLHYPHATVTYARSPTGIGRIPATVGAIFRLAGKLAGN